MHFHFGDFKRNFQASGLWYFKPRSEFSACFLCVVSCLDMRSRWVYRSADVIRETHWVRPLSWDQAKSVFSPVKTEQLVFKSRSFQQALVFTFGLWSGSASHSPAGVTVCLHLNSTKTRGKRDSVAAFLALGRYTRFHSKRRYLISPCPSLFPLSKFYSLFLSVNKLKKKKLYIYFQNVLHNATSSIWEADSCPLRYSLTA